MTETIERIARTVLWISLALVLAAVPIGAVKMQSAETAIKVELKKAEAKIAELSKPMETELFAPKNVGIYLSGLAYNVSEGGMTFTNATEKRGVLCLKGVAKNSKTAAVTESLADCKEIKPFDSNVHLMFKFAPGSLRKACPQDGDCEFSVEPVDKT